MIKVMYDGNMTACRIKVGSTIFNNWGKGVVLELDDETANKLLLNKDFKVVGKMPIKVEKKIVEEIKKVEEVEADIEEEATIDFDLNNDGVVDKLDSTIAGKVLANARKNKEKQFKI